MFSLMKGAGDCDVPVTVIRWMNQAKTWLQYSLLI